MLTLTWGRTATAEELWSHWASIDPVEAVPVLVNLRSNLADPTIAAERNLLTARSDDGLAGFLLCLDDRAMKKPEIYAFRVGADATLAPLVEELERRARADRLQRIRIGCDSEALASRRVEALGYPYLYSAFELEQPLIDAPPPELAAPYSIETLTPETVDDWVAIENESFRGQRNFTELTREQAAYFLSANELGPADVFFATDGSQRVGFVFTRFLEHGVGEISTLGVLRNYRRHGLGQALLLEGMRRLRAAGATTVRLTVVSDNATALRLYERVGFRCVREKRVFEKQL